MVQDRDSQVRDRAHAIWLEEGMPEGQAEQHWSRAESEVGTDETSSTVTSVADTEEVAVGDVASAPASSADEAPELQDPEPAPAAPDVVSITDAAAAPAQAAPGAAKKQTRRKTKPLTPIR